MKRLILTIICGLSIAGIARSEEVLMIVYHTFAPYVIKSDETGLTYDLAKILSERSQGKYQFIVKERPRKRLDTELSGGIKAIVPWVNPTWFQDKEKQKYLWSSAFLTDTNAVLSSTEKKVEYETVKTLYGMRVGTVLGHQYPDLNEPFQQKLIIQETIPNMEGLGSFLVANRVDVVVMPSSTAKYIIKEQRLEGKIHFSSKPLNNFDRHILIQPDLKEVSTYIEEIVSKLGSDAEWQKFLKQYGLS